VRLKGIPEGAIYISKTLINKGLSVIPAQAGIQFPLLSSLGKQGKPSLLTSRIGVSSVIL